MASFDSSNDINRAPVAEIDEYSEDEEDKVSKRNEFKDITLTYARPYLTYTSCH